MAHNLFAPNYGGLRYRSQGLMSRPRRGETTVAPASYIVGDTARATLQTPDGNPDVPWISLTTPDTGVATERKTLIEFPFAAIDEDTLNNLAAAWDYPLNVQNLHAQIVADSTGSGLSDPRSAGLDLMARIWSVKTWHLTGTFAGVTVDETVTAGNRLFVSAGDSSSRTEEVMGEEAGRAFVPTSVAYGYNVDSGDDGEVDVQLSLQVTGATASGGKWLNGGSYLGAGMSDGIPVICPLLIGSLSWEVRDGEGDVTSAGFYWIRSALSPFSPADYTLGDAPVKLCGYQLRGYRQNSSAVGAPDGELHLTASELWGPDEWP